MLWDNTRSFTTCSFSLINLTVLYQKSNDYSRSASLIPRFSSLRFFYLNRNQCWKDTILTSLMTWEQSSDALQNISWTAFWSEKSVWIVEVETNSVIKIKKFKFDSKMLLIYVILCYIYISITLYTPSLSKITLNLQIFSSKLLSFSENSAMRNRCC